MTEQIDAILDRVIETGEPVEIAWQGRKLRIELVESRSKLERLVSRPDAIVGDPADLVHIEWG